MDSFDSKIIEFFPGKAVRKDLTSLMKKGANVPTYVLEYLLGMYCATDDEEAIEIGLDKIKRILADQKETNALLTGNLVGMNDLIFRAPERGLLMATPLDREIKRICKAAGVTPFTMHALRATFATRAIEAGMNPKTLQEILGHSNFNITMSLYGHCLTDTKKQAMEALIIAI